MAEAEEEGDTILSTSYSNFDLLCRQPTKEARLLASLRTCGYTIDLSITIQVRQ